MRQFAAIVEVIVCLAFSSAKAQYLQPTFASSDIVVVARTLSVSPSESGFTWRKDRPETREVLEVSKMTLRVVSYIKGSGAAEINMAAPKKLIRFDGQEPGKFQFDGRVGRQSVWFIQRAGTGGPFFARERESDEQNAELWSAPGLGLAPIYLAGMVPAQVELASINSQTHSLPILRLADLLALNAAQSTSLRPLYLQLLADLTPTPESVRGYGHNAPANELSLYRAWLATRFPEAFPVNVPANQIDAIAIRMWWGEDNLSRIFVNRFLEQTSSLTAPFPPLDNLDDVLRVIPRLEARSARLFFINLRQYPERKMSITQIGVARLGEEHMLDAGILECLAELWNRPDLSPVEGGRIAADLSRQIRLARDLLREEGSR